MVKFMSMTAGSTCRNPLDEIMEDREEHLRKFGGERSEWSVGKAKDARAPFLLRHLAADRDAAPCDKL